VTVNLEPTPKQTSQIAVFVFEDDWPLNGENDAGGGVDVLATNEPGLGGFAITLNDQAGGFGQTGHPGCWEADRAAGCLAGARLVMWSAR
jgi:hypothetical protein